MSPIADRPKRAHGEMPFLDHLEELRWRIIYVVAALAVGTAVGFALVFKYDPIEWLTQPVKPYLPHGTLMVTHIAGPIAIYMQLAFSIGIACAMPVILYQFWAFLAPALHRHERRIVMAVVAASTLLFAAGASLAFFYALPSTFALSKALERHSLQVVPEGSEYFGFLTATVLMFGLAFQIPVVLVGLTTMGVLTASQLARGRRHASVGVFVVASILTPGDALQNTFLLATVLYVLFEASVIVAWALERRRKRGAAGGLGEDDLAALAVVAFFVPGLLRPRRRPVMAHMPAAIV